MIEFDFCEKKKKGILKGKLFNEIREFFSEKNEAAKFLKNRYRFIPNRNYAITPTGRFNIGLTIEIINLIKTKYPTEKYFLDNRLLENIKPTQQWKKSNLYKEDILKLNLNLYDYQEDVVKKCIDNGRGTIILATAGGKTLITSSLINHLKNTVFKENESFKCVVIVPSLSLVDQTVDKFSEYGVNYTWSKWTGSHDLNLATDVIVCNTGILTSKNTDLSFLKTIDLLIIDEVHTLRKGNIINKIVDEIDTPHKYGFTGTLPESNMDKWNIIGKIGPVLYERKSYELRKDNFVCSAQISALEIYYKKQPDKALTVIDRYRNEIDFLINNEYRNKLINKLALNANNNILIMLDFIRHGEKLYDILKNNLKNKEVYFIQGSVETEVREDIRKKMEFKNNVVCIAISKIFSTGIDIKNLHYIVFAGGGKAKIKILQSIGRGLRLHQDKKILQIVDLQDQLYYSVEHAKKRIQFYEQEKIPYQRTEIRE
jgi:superfamily II DNA or RNA helicase